MSKRDHTDPVIYQYIEKECPKKRNIFFSIITVNILPINSKMMPFNVVVVIANTILIADRSNITLIEAVQCKLLKYLVKCKSIPRQKL